MSTAVRSAMPSWSANDCGSNASYRSGIDAVDQGVRGLVRDDVSREARVNELAPRPERVELQAPGPSLVVGVGPPAGPRNDEQLRAVERPYDLAAQRVRLLVHVHRPHDRGEHARLDEVVVVEVVGPDVVAAVRHVPPCGHEDGAGLELLGVGVEVDDGDARRDRAIEVVVLVDAAPFLDRLLDGDDAQVGVLDHERGADAHRGASTPPQRRSRLARGRPTGSRTARGCPGPGC